MLKQRKVRQKQGKNRGLGKGLVDFCVCVSCWCKRNYRNKKYGLDFHTAEVTGSNPVPPIDVKDYKIRS